MNHTLDVDAGDTHTFSLTGIFPDNKFNAGGSEIFEVTTTGEIIVQNLRPNFESDDGISSAKKEYTLSVEVKDSFEKWGAENQKSVTLY